jgi:hypothetical protein
MLDNFANKTLVGSSANFLREVVKIGELQRLELLSSIELFPGGCFIQWRKSSFQ